MSAQNLLSIGFNVQELDAQAQQVLSIVQNLHKELEKYDGMKISPINAAGLKDLTEGIKAQQGQMVTLTTTISELGLAMRTYNQLARETAQNNAKIASSSTDVAKANIASKVQLEEQKRLMKEVAQSENVLFQERKTKADQAKQLKKDEAELNKIIAKEESDEQKRLNKEKAESDKAYVKMYENLLKEKEAADKKAAATKKKIDSDEEKARIAQGKAMLAQNDLFKQLKQKQSDLQIMYQNAIINKAPKNVKESLAQQLSETSVAIENVNKSVEKAGAGGGMKQLGKQLSENLSIVRNLAYILPGIGIAGIFNLAFEAIGKAVEALGFFNSKLDQAIEYQNRLTEATNAYNDAISDQADAFSQSDKANIRYYENQLKLAQSQGANYVQQQESIDNLNKAQKEAADATVQDLGATYTEAASLNAQILSASNQRLVITEKILKVNESLKSKQAETLPLQGIVQGAIKKSGEIAGIESTLEFLNKELEVFDNQTAAAKSRYDKVSDALIAQSSANLALQEESLKRSKYFSDEQRKIILDDAEFELKTQKIYNEMILDNKRSSEAERLTAINNIAEIENQIAEAKYKYVVSNSNATTEELNKAENDMAEKSAEIEKTRAKESAKTIKDFYLKRQEYIFLAAQAEITTIQVTQKKVMENEENSLEDRIEGFEKYTKARQDSAKLQWQKDIKIAQETSPVDLLDDELAKIDSQYKKNISDITNDVRSQAFNISTSWFNQELKLIKQRIDMNQSMQEDSATQELLLLNESFRKKEISYKQYNERIKEIERRTRNEINLARIKDDEEQLGKLKGAQTDTQTKLAGSIFSLAFGGGGEKALGLAEGYKKDYEKITEEVEKGEEKISKDKLKYSTEVNQSDLKAGEERLSYEKQRNAAYAQLAEDGLNMIKDLRDQVFEERMAQIEEENEAMQKSIDLEIAAIERSTLSAKEKNAYEIQLQAQKSAREEEFAKKQRKISHDQAVFDKEISIAKIIAATAVAVVNSLAIPGAGIGLAIAVGAMGAIELATALSTKIPAYAFGGEHKGGPALFGEAGKELVKEPGGRSWIADRPTIKHLPAGTELIPLYDIPVFAEKQDSSWAQTLYLGKQIAKSKREIKNIFKPKINVDLGRQFYANLILYGK